MFYAHELFGPGDLYDFPARLVDALFVLRNEVTLEITNARKPNGMSF